VSDFQILVIISHFSTLAGTRERCATTKRIGTSGAGNREHETCVVAPRLVRVFMHIS
jgi:hypothetical protein